MPTPSPALPAAPPWRRLFVRLLAAVAAVVLHLALTAYPVTLPLLEPAHVQASLARVTGTLVWGAVGWLLLGLLNDGYWPWYERVRGAALPDLVKTITRTTLLFALGIGYCSVVLDAPISGVIAGSSVVAAVVGLAITRMISDVFSGAALNLERSYNIGDWVEVEIPSRRTRMAVGQVVAITWRATHLHTKADELIIIPNSEMARMRLVNFSKPERHYRADVRVHLSHTVPVERAKRILQAAVVATPDVMTDPAPKITLLRFDEAGVLWSARFWIRDFSLNRQVVKAAHESVLTHLQIAGIDLAYPVSEQKVLDTGGHALDNRPLKVRLLHRVPLFAPLTPVQLDHLATALHERPLKAKEVLLTQGEAGDSLFILAEGLLKITRRTDAGADETLAKITPGQYLGEMSLLTGSPRMATATAVTDSLCYEVPKSALAALFEGAPQLLEVVSRAMAKRQAANAKAAKAANPAAAPGPVEDPVSMAGRLLAQMRTFFGFVVERV